MKTGAGKSTGDGFTLVELLLLVSLLTLLALFLMPFRGHRHGTIVPCLNNLRQIGMAMATFAEDHNGAFPQQCSVTNGGSLEFISANSAALHFKTLSPYLRYSKVWVCPADTTRTPATNPLALLNTNISYFFGEDAARTLTKAIVAGDRNLESGGQAVKTGLLVLTTNSAISWTPEMHTKTAGMRCGNIGFVDAHVENIRKDLAFVIQRQGIATNRLVVP